MVLRMYSLYSVARKHRCCLAIAACLAVFGYFTNSPAVEVSHPLQAASEEHPVASHKPVKPFLNRSLLLLHPHKIKFVGIPSSEMSPSLISMASRFSQELGVGPSNHSAEDVHILIMTSWRSGSTYLGNLMQERIAGSYYSFEPLMENVLVANRSKERNHAEILERLFNCNFSDLSYPLDKLWMLEASTQLHSVCQKVERASRVRHVCLNTKIQEAVCSTCRAKITKTVRFHATDLKQLLNKVPKLKVIALFRDPRAVWNSRLKEGWCLRRNCKNLTGMCQRYKSDIEIVRKLESSYPGQIFLLRYEDLVESPIAAIDRILRQFNLDAYQARSSHKMSAEKHRSGAWRTELSPIQRKRVELSCNDSLIALDYNFGP